MVTHATQLTEVAPPASEELLPEEPAWTMTPNILFDYWLGVLSPSEFCVLAYIMRHTFGWRKSADAISFTQFRKGKRAADGSVIDRGCGLSNPTSVKKAIDALIGFGLIERTDHKDDRGATATSTYQLVMRRPVTLDVNPITENVMAPLRLVYSPHYEKRNDPITPNVNTKESSKNKPKEKVKDREGASAPRARKATTPKQELDDDTKRAARAFLDAFCRLRVVATDEKGGFWGEAVKAVQEHALDDLLGVIAYKQSRGVADSIRPRHVAADVDEWVRRGRPATAQQGQPQRRGPVATLTATATEMREAMHGIAFCPECDRVLPNHKQSCSKAAGAKGGAA